MSENIELSPARKRLFTLIMVVGLVLFFFAGLAVAELVARAAEPPPIRNLKVPDPRLGWKPAPGERRHATREFDVPVSVNALYMNDREWTAADLRRPSRVLALGDSHTFAIGVSPQEAWPKRLEALLFKDQPQRGVVMNAGVAGYSLGQYLERYRALRQVIRPTTVVVGFSTATDLYDLVPPERGGFVYGGNAERVFFDIGKDGRLWERKHVPVAAPPKAASSDPRALLQKHSALYRRLKRSKLAMAAATYIRPGGKSLWPGSDTALKINLDAEDVYRWRLAELIIAQLAQEAKADGAQVALVQIPYIAQVYDEVWSSSFGMRPTLYDRDIASRRLAAICKRHGIVFIDTAPPFIEAARRRGHWLHWPVDAHPTPEGQQLIGEVVADGFRDAGIVSSPAVGAIGEGGH